MSKTTPPLPAAHPVSRYPIPALDQLPDDIRAKILEVQEKAGFVPNVFLAFAHRPDEFRAFFAYHDALLLRESGLTKGDKEMIIVATSGANGCLYCVVAHGALLRIYEKNPSFGRIDVKLAIRFDRPKRAVMPAMSQASSSLKP